MDKIEKIRSNFTVKDAKLPATSERKMKFIDVQTYNIRSSENGFERE
jgi:hypothetical protein